jgi:hypothetical protein
VKNVIARKRMTKEERLAHAPASIKDGHRGTRPQEQLTKRSLLTLTID